MPFQRSTRRDRVSDPVSSRYWHAPSAWAERSYPRPVDTRNEIREFLTSRRARITPEQAGLQWYGENRRVPGLRREEMALLAGVSVDYYIRLERGNMSGVSESVLEALARALQLDEAERAHLFDLARTAGTTTRTVAAPRSSGSGPQCNTCSTRSPARPRSCRTAAWTSSPRTRSRVPSTGDVRRPGPAGQPRTVRVPRSASARLLPRLGACRERHGGHPALRAGRDPYDRGLSDLVGELSTQSEAFRTRWAAHNVRIHQTGVKHVHHPVVGDLSLTFEMMGLRADTGLTILSTPLSPARSPRRR